MVKALSPTARVGLIAAKAFKQTSRSLNKATGIEGVKAIVSLQLVAAVVSKDGQESLVTFVDAPKAAIAKFGACKDGTFNCHPDLQAAFWEALHSKKLLRCVGLRPHHHAFSSCPAF